MRTTLNIEDLLFISAPNGGGLFHAHRHLLMPLTNEDTTGISLSGEGIVWCVQSDGGRWFREVRQGALSTASAAEGPLDLHDVLSTADGNYAVFTETNRVVRLDHAFQVQESWSFGDEPDSAHVNCIAMHDGRLIASMFGAFATHRGYKGKTRRSGQVIDVRSGDVLIEKLSQPHSLVTVGEQLWLCSSEDRAVHVYDRNFRLERERTLPGYTRGLAVGQDFVYVGLSRSRNLESGDVGEFTSAVVAVLNRHSLEVVGYLPLPCNEIYDIRIAPSAEMVTDAMAATWVSERDVMSLAMARTRRSLEDVEEDLRNRDLTLRSTEDALAHAKRQLKDAEAYGRSEVVRLTAMVSAADEYAKNEVTRLTRLADENMASVMAQAAEERARLLQQASEDLTRMMEQVAT
ncbi:MAG: DUF4915 domain-containing protein, partial [Rhodanobacter sp.]